MRRVSRKVILGVDPSCMLQGHRLSASVTDIFWAACSDQANSVEELHTLRGCGGCGDVNAVATG